MKIDVEIEYVDNGFVVKMNQLRRFCHNERAITRMLFDLLNRNPPPSDFSERMKEIREGKSSGMMSVKRNFAMKKLGGKKVI